MTRRQLTDDQEALACVRELVRGRGVRARFWG